MEEPLTPDPEIKKNTKFPTPFYEGKGVAPVESVPEAYAIGFHDGAYKLADKLVKAAAKGGTRALVEELSLYANGYARPTRDWSSAPVRNRS